MTRTGVGNHDRYNVKTKGSQQHPRDLDDVSVSTESSDDETVSSQLCCLQGCLATSAVGFAFFVGLPSGILLVFYASRNSDTTLLAVGGVLIVLPVLTLLVFVVICLYRQRLKKLSKNRVNNNMDLQKPASGENSKY